MTSLRILSALGDAGGAEAVAPVLAYLTRVHRASVTVVTTSFSDPIARRFGLPTRLVSEAGADASRAWFEEVQPDVLVTGTSWGEARIEPSFIETARVLGVPSLAVLDYWSNYRQRFADERNELRFLPDRVAVMDRIALSQMMAAGIPGDRLVVTGAPQFEALLATPAGAGAESGKFRAARGIGPSEMLILFVSQPIDAVTATGSRLGFGEREVLHGVRDTLARLPWGGTGPVLAIRRHPREGPIALKTAGFPREIDAAGPNAGDWVAAADVVIGMNSALLLHASLLGRLVVSVQPGLRGPDPLPSNRLGLSHPVYDLAHLRRVLGHVLRPAYRVPTARSRQALEALSAGATERVAHTILKVAARAMEPTV